MTWQSLEWKAVVPDGRKAVSGRRGREALTRRRGEVVPRRRQKDTREDRPEQLEERKELGVELRELRGAPGVVDLHRRRRLKDRWRDA